MVGIQKILILLLIRGQKFLKEGLHRASSRDFYVLAKISHFFMLEQRNFFFESADITTP